MLNLAASKVGNVEILKVLLEHGAKPYLMNNCGTTPLHVAVEGGHDTVIEVLTPLEEATPGADKTFIWD